MNQSVQENSASDSASSNAAVRSLLSDIVGGSKKDHGESKNDSSPSSSGTSMLLRLQDQDPQAWEQLVKLYGPLVFHWCQTCRLNAADSADVLQEVFSSVSQKIISFQRRGNGTLRGWLWMITQNKIRDHFRRAKKREAAAGGTNAQLQMAEFYDDNIEELDSAEEPTDPIESHRLLHRAMSQIKTEFSERSWKAFWECVVNQNPTAEVAEQLGLSASGVRQAKRRVLRRLKQQLGDID